MKPTTLAGLLRPEVSTLILEGVEASLYQAKEGSYFLVEQTGVDKDAGVPVFEKGYSLTEAEAEEWKRREEADEES